MKHQYLAALAALLLAPSCGRQQQPVVDTIQADALYDELCNTYRSYTDSLRSLSCDTLVNTIEEELGDALRKVYARYPADLDSRLSQAQNDTLWSLASQYMELRRNCLHRSAAPSLPDSDSVPPEDAVK